MTRVRAYSTLEVPHSLRSVGIAMDSKPPEDNRSEITKIVAARKDNKVTADRAQAERILKDLLARRGISVPENREEMEKRMGSTAAPVHEAGDTAPVRAFSNEDLAKAKSAMDQGKLVAADIARAVAQKYGSHLPDGNVPGSREFTLNQAPQLPQERQGYAYDAFNEVDADGNEIPEAAGGRGRRRGEERITEQVILQGLPEGQQLHPLLREQLAILQMKQDSGIPMDFDDMKKFAEEIIKMPSPAGSPIPPEQRQRLVQLLSQQAIAKYGQEADGRRRFGFYLEAEALKALDDNPMRWLDEQFNQIYEIAKAGQELDSPSLQRIQTLVGEASGYLQERSAVYRRDSVDSPETLRKSQDKRKLLEEFNTKFGVRLNLIFARTAVESRNMEQIIGAVQRLRVDGMIGALSYDDKRVGSMFGRMQGQLEYLRLSEGGTEHHLNPDTLNRLQETTIEEQFMLAKNGLGVFADVFSKLAHSPENTFSEAVDDALRTEIQRSVRTAYDVLVISQRVAVLGARGGNQAGTNRQYYSDSGAAFAIFGFEDTTIQKWAMFNKDEDHFFDFIKLDLALNKNTDYDTSSMTRAQLLDLGGRIFKELYAVPDFFSSSWRMTVMREQMIDTMTYKFENDAMIQKLVEGGEFNSANPKLNDLVEDINDQVGRAMATWNSENPDVQNPEDPDPSDPNYERRRLPEDVEIAKRKIAREIFENKLDRNQRDLALSVLTTEDKDKIKAEVVKLAGTKKGREVGDLGLFVQLKQNLGNQDRKIPEWDALSKEEKKKAVRDHKKEVWEKIKTYKTEDIIRIVRGRAKGGLYADDKDNLRRIDRLFRNVDSTLGDFSPEEKELRNTQGLEALTTYDKFQKKYGAILHAVRQDAMHNRLKGPSQVDFTKLNDRENIRYKKMIDRAIGPGSADNVVEIFTEMKKFIDEKHIIEQFTDDHRYVDLYARVISVDDLNLEDYQNVPKNSRLMGMAGKITAEGGGDGLLRNMKDISNAINAGNAFIKFVSVEGTDDRFKAAKEMKSAVEAYNGRDDGAMIARFLSGTEILYAMQDYWVNMLRLGGLPLRKPTSQKQRDYGIGANAITRQQIREMLDHHSGEFTGRGDDAYKWLIQLEQMTETDDKGRLKMNAITLLFYAFFGIAVGLPAGAAFLSVNEATK